MVARSRWRAIPATALVVAALLFAAAPAQAHTESEPAAGDYLTTLREMTPAVPGLTVRVVHSGTRMELHNRTGATVDVLGYSGEPYLRITPEATYVNADSPSAYRNGDLDAVRTSHETTGAHHAGHASTPPNWQALTDSPRVRWHDHRTHWMGEQPPPAVQRTPEEAHRIANWNIVLRLSNKSLSEADTPAATGQYRQVQLRGTLDYLPPPRTGLWWAGMLAVSAAIVAVSFAVGYQPARRRYVAACLGGLLLVAAATELVDGVGRMLDWGATGPSVLGRLLLTETYGTLTALAALLAAGLAFRQHAAAPFALALSAPCLTVLGALTDVAVFSHSRANVPWSGDLARLCVAATLVLGAAVSVGAWRLIATAQDAPIRRAEINTSR